MANAAEDSKTLTDKAIKALKPQTERYEVRDPGFPEGSFSVRVTPNGAKTFYLRYRTLDGRQRRVSVGAYPVTSLGEARKKARRMMGDVARGEDPAEERQERREGLTFGDLWKLYLERYAKAHKRSWAYDEGLAKHDLLPVWKHRKISDLTRSDVVMLLDSISDRGAPVLANRVRSLVSRIFNFGISRGLCEHNPATHAPKPAKEHSRDRVLSSDEIKSFWKACSAEPLMVGAMFKLRLLTAQRGVELRSMRWREVDGEAWTIPAEIAKNRKAHRVPLSKQAAAILDEVRAVSGEEEYVFPARNGPGHAGTLNKAFERIREATKAQWRPHDLRRTAATFMTAELGIGRLVVSKILNHAERGLTAVYDRADYFQDMKRALMSWGGYVAALVREKETSDES
jgi:integrase